MAMLSLIIQPKVCQNSHLWLCYRLSRSQKYVKSHTYGCNIAAYPECFYYFCSMRKERSTIIGRQKECDIIQQLYDSPKAELVAVYGRRRVGKTYLVKQFFEEDFAFSFTGLYHTSRQVQLSLFMKELSKRSQTVYTQPATWFEAFDHLKDYLSSLKQDRMVVFIDELPWMDTPKSNFIAAFSYFWNTWGSTCPTLKLFVCGSATTWMLNNIIGDKGGLYGRCSRSIYLSPFTLGEVESFLKETKGIIWNRYQTLEAYMVMGGIPYYLDMLDGSLPFVQNIDRLFFSQDAPLRQEYEFLYRSLFEDATIYRRIVETLATRLKGMTRAELQKILKIKSGGTLTTALGDLCQCDFIRQYAAIGKNTRDCLYQLTDLFTLFHLRFVSKSAGQDEHFWQNIHATPLHATWAGYAFEQACLHHIPQIKAKLGIAGVLSNVSTWSCKPFTDKDGTLWDGGQIDMLIDRNDNVISLCEMKHANDEFAIDARYEQRLRSRAATFAHAIKTRKALQHVFITTYGVKNNAHRAIVQNEVTMDDLYM